MNYFRIPLNLMVVVILLKVGQGEECELHEDILFSFAGFSIENHLHRLCGLSGHRRCLYEFITQVRAKRSASEEIFFVFQTDIEPREAILVVLEPSDYPSTQYQIRRIGRSEWRTIGCLNLIQFTFS